MQNKEINKKSMEPKKIIIIHVTTCQKSQRYHNSLDRFQMFLVELEYKLSGIKYHQNQTKTKTIYMDSCTSQTIQSPHNSSLFASTHYSRQPLPQSLVLSTSSTQKYLRNLGRRFFVVFPTSSSHKPCACLPRKPKPNPHHPRCINTHAFNASYLNLTWVKYSGERDV